MTLDRLRRMAELRSQLYATGQRNRLVVATQIADALIVSLTLDHDVELSPAACRAIVAAIKEAAEVVQ